MSNVEEETAEERKLYEKLTNRILSSSYIQTLREKLSGERKIAVLVDGPNFLRKVNGRQIKLEEIGEKIKDMGKTVVRKVLLNEFASEKLIQAVTNSGYEPIVSPYDIYITLSIEVMNILKQNSDLEAVIIASRHARITPILLKLKEKGIETAIIGFEPGFSVAAKKHSDKIFQIE